MQVSSHEGVIEIEVTLQSSIERKGMIGAIPITLKFKTKKDIYFSGKKPSEGILCNLIE